MVRAAHVEQEALLRKQEEARRVIEDAPRKLQQLKKRQREPIESGITLCSMPTPAS